MFNHISDISINNKSNLRDLIAAIGLIVLLKLESNWVTVRKRPIRVKIDDFWSRLTEI